MKHGGVLAVVADGMGGLDRGDEASRVAVRTFLATYGAKAPERDISSALEASALQANDAVNALPSPRQQDGPGSTLVAAVVHADELHWVAAGDSCLYLWRAGSLTQLNTHHVYARALDMAVKTGALSDEAAQSDGQRDALTSYLGMGAALELDRNLRPLKLQTGDRILLCTDGLSKTLVENEIASVLRTGDAQQSCEALVNMVLDRQTRGQDNVTVLLLDVSDDVAAKGRKRWWHWGSN